MKTIPLHSLVILIRPLGTELPEAIQGKFDDYEIISAEQVKYDLVGDTNRMDINSDVYGEIYRRANVKLRLGERVVIDAPNLRQDDRIQSAKIGTTFDVPVFYLIYDQPLKDKIKNHDLDPSIIQRHHQIFKNSEKDILRGDHLAETIDLRQEDFSTIKKPLETDTLTDVLMRNGPFRGVTVIPDVHGTLESFKTAVNWARNRGHLMVLLGDVIDYGPKPLECVELAYDLVTRGEAVMIMGNHERKIERYFQQKNQGNIRVRISEGNKVTLDALDNLPDAQADKWIKKFRALVCHMRHHWVLENFLFTHGAAAPEMFSLKGRRLPHRSTIENMALFGEIDEKNPRKADGYPNRVYNWVDRIPNNCVVIVGHDIRDTAHPYRQKGQKGGEAIFLDTGSGKGGSISTCDIKATEDGLKITNFNKH